MSADGRRSQPATIAEAGDLPPIVPLFVYGTLRDPETQVAVFGRALTGVADAIVGYRLGWVLIDDAEIVRKSGTSLHPIAEPSADVNDVVEGLVLQASASDIEASDAYEHDYARVGVNLASGGEASMYRHKGSR